jgi:hypothetical protein
MGKLKAFKDLMANFGKGGLGATIGGLFGGNSSGTKSGWWMQTDANHNAHDFSWGSLLDMAMGNSGDKSKPATSASGKGLFGNLFDSFANNMGKSSGDKSKPATSASGKGLFGSLFDSFANNGKSSGDQT